MFKLGFLTACASLSLLLGSGVAQAQSPPKPQEFVNAAGQSDQYEMTAALLAKTQSENGRVRAFAQQMLDDHKEMSEAMMRAAAASGLTPPSKTMSGDQANMLSGLQSMKGPDLDRAYITQQVNTHSSALVTQKGYAATGSDPNLRKVAQTAVPTIQHHLEMAQQLKASLGES